MSPTFSWNSLICAVLVFCELIQNTLGAPLILKQPKNQSVVFGQRAVFYVAAKGDNRNFVYQWRKDGAAIPGATSDQYVLASSSYFDSGRYSVMVRDSGGSVTSAEAELTVRPPLAGDVDYRVLSDSWINGKVTSLAVQEDGEVLIGGDFLTVNSANRRRLARLNADGTTDFRFMDGMAGIGDRDWDSISAVAMQSGGKILVGGTFVVVNGLSKSGLVRLNEDGSIDETFHGSGIEGYVYALSVQDAGKIVIGGSFRGVNGVSRESLARLNEDGSLDLSFVSPLTNSASVYALAVQADGKVLISSMGKVLRLNTNGSVDETFAAPDFGYVSRIALDQNENILVAAAGSRLVRLNKWGTEETNFGAIMDGTVNAILPTGDKIFIGGSFTKVNGSDHHGIAKLNSDGTTDNTFTAQGGDWTAVTGMDLQEEKLVIGGSFQKVNGRDRINVARLNLDGTLDETFRNEESISVARQQIRALGQQKDGKIVAAGLDNEGGNVFSRLNPDLSLDRGFLQNRFFDTAAIAIQSSGKIVAGGYGWTIFRVNADGTEDIAFTKPVLSLPRWDLAALSPFRWPEVLAIISQPDDKFVVGGYFNAGLSNNISRFQIDGALDENFKAGANLEVRCLALQGDGKIVLGGLFTTVNGVTRNGIARVEATGNLDNGFLNGLVGVQGGTVETVALQADGKILIGGSFTDVNMLPRSGLARLNEDGTVDEGFLNIGQSSVSRLAVDGEGRVLVAGTISGEPNVLIRLRADGSVDDEFRKLVAAPSGIRAIEVLSDNSLVVGGSFTSINGNTILYRAHVWGEPPLLLDIRQKGAKVDLSWGTRLNRTYQLQYRNDLPNPEWNNLQDVVVGTDEIIGKSDSASLGQRFYRITEAR